ncbi:MAG: LamG domain-containing protein [Polyangiaceae bacterium]|nr:LamG domain-containing protein [Polyangiaceae bacterium]
MRHIFGVVLLALITAGCTGFDLVVQLTNTPDAASSGSDADATDVTNPGTDGDASDASDDAADTPDANPYNARVTDGLVALFDFEEGAGTTVHDRVDDPADNLAAYNLTIPDDGKTQWLPHALSITDFTSITSDATFDKALTACQMSNEVSVEAWVVPATANSGTTGRIVNMSGSGGPVALNFMLGSSSTAWEWGLNAGERVILSSPLVTTDLTHLVATRTSDGTSRFYMNGAVAGAPYNGVASLSGWQKYPLVIGNAPAGSRGWQGEIHLIAVYCRALTADEVTQNFAAGADP